MKALVCATAATLLTSLLASSASAYSPGTVYVLQPFPTAGTAVTALYHNYTEGASSLYPVDVNKGYDEGGTQLAVDLTGLPPGSQVHFNGYNNNITACSEGARSGNRYVVDIWVTPPGKAKKYLGYVVMLHTQNNRIGSWTAVDSNYDGRVTEWTSQVWDGPEGTVIYTKDGSRECWDGDHVHMFASRDYSFESQYGTFTTFIDEAKNPFGGTYDVTYSQELYYFSTDWDK
jgi:3D (Asp-Asp-Asp) domain-containing protein